jgi:hypothetical protein
MFRCILHLNTSVSLGERDGCGGKAALLTLSKGEFKYGKFSKKRVFCHKVIFRQSIDKLFRNIFFIHRNQTFS